MIIEIWQFVKIISISDETTFKTPLVPVPVFPYARTIDHTSKM
jgi:hypothetical protein